MGWVIQSVDGGQFVKNFCPLVFVKGLQFELTWTEESLKDIISFSPYLGYFCYFLSYIFTKNRGCWKHKRPVVIKLGQ